MIQPLNLRSQVGVAHNVVPIKNAISLPAGELFDSAAAHSSGVHLTREATPQVVKGSAARNDFNGTSLSAFPDGLDNARNTGAITGRFPAFLEGANRAADGPISSGIRISASSRCREYKIGRPTHCRCGHSRDFHRFGQCLFGCECGKQLSHLGGHRENSPFSALRIRSARVYPYLSACKIHITPSQGSNFLVSPSCQETQPDHTSDWLGQKRSNAGDLVACKESGSHVILFQKPDLRHSQKLSAVKGEYERVPDEFQLSVNRTRRRAFSEAVERIAANLSRRDSGGLLLTEDGNDMEAVTRLLIIDGLKPVNFVVRQDVVGELAEQDGIRPAGHRQTLREFAQTDGKLTIGLVSRFERFGMPYAVRVGIADPERRPAVLDISSAFSHASASRSSGGADTVSLCGSAPLEAELISQSSEVSK